MHENRNDTESNSSKNIQKQLSTSEDLLNEFKQNIDSHVIQVENEGKIETEFIKIKYHSKLPENKMIKIVKSSLGTFAYFGQRKGFPLKGLDHLFNIYNEPLHSFCTTSGNGARFLYFDPLNQFEIVNNELERLLSIQEEKERMIQKEKEQENERKRLEEKEKERIQQLERANAEKLRAEQIHEQKLFLERQKTEIKRKYFEMRSEALRLHKQQNGGLLSLFIPTKKFREAQCFRCQRHLFSSTHSECHACRWIVCNCGACGCNFMKG